MAEVAADHRLVALLDRARRQPGLPPGTQARLAARWAIATYWQPGGQEKSRRASATAVTLAEQAGDTEALGAALIARQFTLRGPGFLDERLAAGVAVLDIAGRTSPVCSGCSGCMMTRSGPPRPPSGCTPGGARAGWAIRWRAWAGSRLPPRSADVRPR